MRTLAYILSSSYSGSTLLSMFLANHPDISTVGELKASALGEIDRYDCSCGVRISNCPFWIELGKTLSGNNIPFSLDAFGTHFRQKEHLVRDILMRASVRNPLFEMARHTGLNYWPGARGGLNRILDQNDALMKAVCEIQGGEVFLDASKEPVRLDHLKRLSDWNIKIIYMVRDGRGTTNSFRRHTGRSVGEAAYQWLGAHWESKRVLDGFSSSDWVLLRYEDFCKDTQGELRKIYDFLGLNSEMTTSTYDPKAHHILGNEMRLRSFSRVRLDEKWRESLDEKDLQEFTRLAGPLNRELGYI